MSDEGPLLLTGGAGFIGVNAADRFARAGRSVRVFDDLSRPGSRSNLEWLLSQHPGRVDFVHGDIRDPVGVATAVMGSSAVLHLAAQVAVTTSLAHPATDFAINAVGTFHVLEAMRTSAPDVPLLFASTNKVYGGLDDMTLLRTGRRWLPDKPAAGVSEEHQLDFHSPYGCSKGAGDQYVRDYARCFGLRTVVLRQSCVYGTHQYGNEDQGWVAHFVHAIIERRPITIFGDGFQVRDLLDVRDLCRLFELCFDRVDDCTGEAFNVGGGPSNAHSVIEVIESIAALLDVVVTPAYGPMREGDQRYYVSDISRVHNKLGWKPEIPFNAGLDSLVAWASGLERRD
jgi:CDP-paratose 2-epimerase